MSKAKILIIDDEKDFRDSLKSILQSDDYEVIAASDGEEGLMQIKTSKPDLIICDIRMPKKDGFEVLKELRKDVNFRTPFVMLTILDDLEKAKKAYDEKADFYVTKPVDSFALLKNIRILLTLSKSRIK